MWLRYVFDGLGRLGPKRRISDGLGCGRLGSDRGSVRYNCLRSDRRIAVWLGSDRRISGSLGSDHHGTPGGLPQQRAGVCDFLHFLPAASLVGQINVS